MNTVLQLCRLLLDALKKPWMIILLFLILAAVALSMPTAWAQQMGIDEWLRSHRVVQWATFLGADVLLLLLFATWAGMQFLILWRLHHLSDDERRVLWSFVRWDSRTRSFISGAPTATALTKTGILSECKVANPNHYREQTGQVSCTIKPWIHRYLRKRSALIEFSDNIPPPPTTRGWPDIKQWLEATDGGTKPPNKN